MTTLFLSYAITTLSLPWFLASLYSALSNIQLCPPSSQTKVNLMMSRCTWSEQSSKELCVYTTLCEVRATWTAINRKVSSFWISFNYSIERNTRWIRKKALLDKLKDLLCSYPTPSIEKGWVVAFWSGPKARKRRWTWEKRISGGGITYWQCWCSHFGFDKRSWSNDLGGSSVLMLISASDPHNQEWRVHREGLNQISCVVHGYRWRDVHGSFALLVFVLPDFVPCLA